MDRQDAFNDLMSKESKPPKKPTNEHNPVVCDNTPTSKKKEQQFEGIEYMEEEDSLGMSLEFLDRL